MGNQLMRSVDDSTVSSDLHTLGSPEPSLDAKTDAFTRLRTHFVKTLTTQEKLAACEAIEKQRYYPVWPKPPSSASRLSSDQLADRVRGLVFGCALGDSTGLATEFLSAETVQQFYGNDSDVFCPKPDKIFPDTHRLMWQAGDWTDDTDQLILVMQTLLSCVGSLQATEGDDNKLSDTELRRLECDFAQRLHTWAWEGFRELGDEGGAGLGHQTKRVMTTEGYLEKPTEVSAGVWKRGGCWAAANGAAMRTAVCGVPYFWKADTHVPRITSSVCRTTHADPRCVASCVAITTCVALLLQGLDLTKDEDDVVVVEDGNTKTNLLGSGCVDGILEKALAAAEKELSICFEVQEEETYLGELQKCFDHDNELEVLHLDDPNRIGYTFKCLAAGLWGLRYPEQEQREDGHRFKSMVQQLVAAGGDADTNASVAGALLGCRVGFSNLPSEWIAQMPHAAWLEAHVQKLLYMLGAK